MKKKLFRFISRLRFHWDWIQFLKLYQKTFKDINVLKWSEKVTYKKWKKFLNWSEKFEEYIKSEFFKGGFKGLQNLFEYLVDMYAYSVSAEKIVEKYMHKGNKGLAFFWKYRIMNYHIYDFIPRYFSFMDQAAYFVASLTEWKILSTDEHIYNNRISFTYKKFKKILERSLSNPNDIVYLSNDDRRKMYDFLDNMDLYNRDRELFTWAKNYRDSITHNKFPGIGHTIYPVVPSFHGKSFRIIRILLLADLTEPPPYSFDKIKGFAETVIPMIDDSFKMLFETDIMKSLLPNIEETNSKSRKIIEP